MFEDDQKQRACICINPIPPGGAGPVHCHCESRTPMAVALQGLRRNRRPHKSVGCGPGFSLTQVQEASQAMRRPAVMSQLETAAKTISRLGVQ